MRSGCIPSPVCPARSKTWAAGRGGTEIGSSSSSCQHSEVWKCWSHHRTHLPMGGQGHTGCVSFLRTSSLTRNVCGKSFLKNEKGWFLSAASCLKSAISLMLAKSISPLYQHPVNTTAIHRTPVCTRTAMLHTEHLFQGLYLFPASSHRPESRFMKG